jgi:hypothetical protein
MTPLLTELHLYADPSGIPRESARNQEHRVCGSPERLEQLLGTDGESVWIHDAKGWKTAMLRLIVGEFLRKGLPVWLETHEDGMRWRKADP